MQHKATSAKDYPVSDTAPLRPDTRDLESASRASCASRVAFPASPASCASCVSWQPLLKFHASGGKLIHYIPSWHMRQSNSASCASRLVPQYYCLSGFTTERDFLQGYPWIFLGVVQDGFSALSLTCNVTNCCLIITLNIHIPGHPAEYSTTTTPPIQDLTPGGCWDQR